MKNKYAIAVCNLLTLHTEIYFLNGSSKLEALQHWARWYLHKDFASFDNFESSLLNAMSSFFNFSIFKTLAIPIY